MGDTMISTMFLYFLACGAKSSDTSTEDTSSIDTAQQDTGETTEPSSEDTGSTDTGDTSDTEEPPDSGDTSDQNPLDDTGNNEVNNSETPPTTECTTNSVIANIDSVYESEQSFASFYWTMANDENGLKVIFAGYKASADVDICATLQNDYPEYPQVVVTARPTLSELPQQLNVGLWDITTNAGAQGYLGDPALQRIFWVTEGSITINSVIENEKASISELQLAQLGEDVNGAGDWENLAETTGYIRLEEGSSITACYCAGLANIYE